jgi:Tfp pilus assembly ATPase PilU
MRDGSQDGMQYFDGEIEKLIRSGVIDLETGLSYATNSGNLQLELADFIDGQEKKKPEPEITQDAELEVTQ